MRLVPAVFALFVTAVAAHAQVYGSRPDGTRVASLASPSAQAVVLYFVATDCPVSNRTFPEMKRVRQAFAARGIAFWYVYPNTTETPTAVRRHQAAFDPGAPTLLDDQGVLTRLAHAVATPEAVVLTRSGNDWQPVYAGRIDDRYLRLGVERPSVQNHFVERVLNELLSGQPVEAAVGNPVGCAIYRPGEAAGPK
jgi:hypothetical protein